MGPFNDHSSTVSVFYGEISFSISHTLNLSPAIAAISDQHKINILYPRNILAKFVFNGSEKTNFEIFSPLTLH